MRKYLFIFSLLAVMLFSLATASAANEKVTVIDENYDLKSIKTLAIATPYYHPSALTLELNAKKRPNAPQILTGEMLVNAAVETAKQDNVPMTVLTDQQINSSILNDTGTDITKLDRATAKKLYKDNIKNYADAYVVFTFSNDSVVVMTADIYDAKTNAYLYSYRINSGGQSDDTLANYNMFMHKFFRTLEIQTEAKK